MDFKAILHKGYFPREIPPPFHTSKYGTVVSDSNNSLPNDFDKNHMISIASDHNLARSGALRRKLSIPNPINYYQIAKFIAENDDELIKYSNRSAISLTKPGSRKSPRVMVNKKRTQN